MAEKRLKKYITTRKSHVNSVNNIIDELKNIYSNYNDGLLTKLVSSLKTLTTQKAKICELHENIVDLEVNDDNIEKWVEEQVQYEQFLNEQVLILEQFIEKHSQNEDTVSVKSTSSYRDSRVKLPKLSIKPFRGCNTDWPEFFDSFSCAIHENESLSNVQKMNYLVNLLEGQASDVIKGLSLSNENYNIALQLLKDRYSDDQILISMHMNKLLSLSPVRKDDVNDLRKLIDVIKSQIRGLERMKIEAKNYGPLLLPVILTKIPDDIKLIISRKFGKNIWNAEPILEELESELFAREKLSAMKQTTSGEIDTEFEKEFSAQSLLNSDSNIVLCVFCKKGNHKPRNCRNIASISERTNILQKAGRCFLCLRKGHVVKNCPAKFSCFN